jgi:hypothetical protein
MPDGKLLYNVPRCGLTSMVRTRRVSSLWPVHSGWPGTPLVMHGGSVHVPAYLDLGGLHTDKELGNGGLHMDRGGAVHRQRQVAHRQQPQQRRCPRLERGTSRLHKDSSSGIVFSTDAMLGGWS